MFSTNVFGFNMARHPHKTMLTGYESMYGDMNKVLKKISHDAYKEVTKPCLGSYTKFDRFSTQQWHHAALRNGTMLHYVVFKKIRVKSKGFIFI